MKLLLLLTLLTTFSVPAQPATAPSTEKVVLLLTFGPGDAVYERWGHNEIVILNPTTKEQSAYHYGVFDFDQPNFIGRFVLGRMLYSMGVQRGDEVDAWLQDYIASDRDVWMQRLNLPQAQIDRLQAYLENNWQPENRNYLYEYYRANCSTKLRDALDYAVDGELKRQWGDVLLDTSFRRFTRIGSADFPLIYAGLSFSLSWKVDEKITLWDMAFVPMSMRESLNRIEINGEPFVMLEERMHTSRHLHPRDRPPQWIGYFLAIGLAMGAGMFLCGVRFSRGKWTNRCLLTIGVAWSFLAGFGGIFLIFAWCTDHVSSHANQNLLLFSPLSLAMLVLLPARVWGRSHGRWALPVARAIVVLAILSLAVKITPIPRQWNWEIIALALPAHMGLMMALNIPKPKRRAKKSAEAS
jgi:hypothetical protein